MYHWLSSPYWLVIFQKKISKLLSSVYIMYLIVSIMLTMVVFAIMSRDGDPATIVSANGNTDEDAEFDVRRDEGNIWFYEDFPFAGPHANELLE